MFDSYMIAGPYCLTVDYQQSLSSMIGTGDYRWVDSNINPDKFLIGQGLSSIEAVVVECLALGEMMEFIARQLDYSNDAVLSALETLELRPATLPELLAFGAGHIPAIPRTGYYVALGSTATVGLLRRRYACCIRRDDNGSQRLELSGWKGLWNNSRRYSPWFLAVRKPLASRAVVSGGLSESHSAALNTACKLAKTGERVSTTYDDADVTLRVYQEKVEVKLKGANRSNLITWVYACLLRVDGDIRCNLSTIQFDIERPAEVSPQTPDMSREQGISNTKETVPLKIFYCYAHEDKDLRDRIDKHLATLKRLGHVIGWYDREIQAGTDWEREIEAHLSTASIILLLVSADFVNSDYCYGKEMQKALEMQEQGKARVLPILLRPVDWQDAPFAKLQMLPTDAKPITSWSDPEEPLKDVAKQIRAVVNTLRARQS